ncbi:MAG: endospore germination permease [Firmicutes bacterium]|nr:endospore germination permease [Bacillota bacterium]
MNSSKILISPLQLFAMMIGGEIAIGHMVYGHMATVYAGRDVWASLLLGCACGAIVLQVIVRLAMAQGDRSFASYCVDACGGIAGRAIAFLYFFYFVLVSSLTFHLLGGFLGGLYIQTPYQVLIVLLFTLIVWALKSGLEVIARAIFFLLPVLLVLGILLTLVGMPDRQWRHLLPVFDHGFGSLWRGAVIFAAMAAELVVYLTVTGSLTDRSKLPKQAIWVVLAFVLSFLGPITGPIMLFGERLASRLTYPTFAELDYIQVSSIVQRLDIVGIGLWLVGGYIRTSLFAGGALLTISELVGFAGPGAETLFVIPVVALMIGLSLLMPGSIADDYQFLLGTYPVISLFMGVVGPIVLWALSGRAARSLHARLAQQSGDGGTAAAPAGDWKAAPATSAQSGSAATAVEAPANGSSGSQLSGASGTGSGGAASHH